MKQCRKSLLFTIIVLAGLWGCTNEPAHQTAIKNKESRIAALKGQIELLEMDRSNLGYELENTRNENLRQDEEIRRLRIVETERNDLRDDLARRLAELDATVAHLEGLRTGLRDLLHQAEVALPVRPKSMTAFPCSPEDSTG